MFLNRDNTARQSYSTSYAPIRRLARKAGIPAADRLSPRSLRHSFATELLGAGVPLLDVKDAMGHADPAPPAATTGPGTTSTATRPTRWPANYAGRLPQLPRRSLSAPLGS